MSELPTPQSPTLAPSRISPIRFKQLLNSKSSPATAESDQVFAILVEQLVDPSFALAQFRVESQYGTAGFAKITGSWGNMLYDSHLTILASGKKTFTVGSTSYTYATYDNYTDAITDYCRYIHWYITEYGLTTIYGATARWIGKTPGSAGHISYVNTIISDMVAYEYPPGEFYEAGDTMINGAGSFNMIKGKVLTKYPIVNGTILYRGTNGDILKKFQGSDGQAWFLGPVNGSWDWGVIGIDVAPVDGDIMWVYIKNPRKTKVIKV